VKALYLGQDRQTVESLVDRYHLAIVYVGRLEERTYGRSALAKFAEWDDLFQPIFSNERVGIFAVTRYFRWDAGIMPLETIVPRSAAEQQAQAEPEPKPGELSQPRGIAVDSKGNLWVVDFGHAKIQSFDPSLKPLRSFGKSGQEPGEFRDPCGIAIGPDDRIYVADTWNGRVQVFDPDGRFERQWAKEFFGPRGIAVDRQGSVFVADTGNGRILKFTAKGDEIWRVGTKGSGAGQFNEPVGIAVGGDGRIYVADAGNRRIVVLDASGAPQETWPVPGWDKDAFREPYLALLPDGRVVAADPTKDRLYYFRPNGQLAAEQPFPDDSAPVGVAVGAKGKLFVTELKKGRISAVTTP
jgi:DNA-binding beta-propeller fold protein YncE